MLERLYDKAITEGIVQEAKQDIHASLELERTESDSLRVKDFFWDTSAMQTARRIRTGMILIGVAYLMGIDMIFYYTSTIFQVYIGLSPLTASGLAAAATTVLATTNYIGAYYMEKLGRRTWLIGGAIGQSTFMLVFTVLLSQPSSSQIGAAAAAMLFGWIAVFGPTWGPVTVSLSNNPPSHHEYELTSLIVRVFHRDHAAQIPPHRLLSECILPVDRRLLDRIRRSDCHRRHKCWVEDLDLVFGFQRHCHSIW